MKQTRRAIIAAGPGVVALLAVGSRSAAAPQPVLTSANVATVQKGHRVGPMLGNAVRNDDNERVGTVDDVVIGQDYTPFVVLQVGDFLELASHRVVVPFRTLVVDNNSRKIMLPGATRKALRNFPEFRFPS